MSTINAATLLSQAFNLGGSAEATSPLASVASRDQASEHRLKAWQAVLSRASVWAQDASQFEEEDLPPPSAATLSRAWQLADEIKDGGAAAPTRIVPDTHAGIVFEWATGKRLVALSVRADQSVLVRVFEDGCLIRSEPLAVS